MSDSDFGNTPEENENEARPAQPTGATGMGDAGRIEALEAELAEQKDKLLRAYAETENVRRRLEREREDVIKFAVAKFAGELLPVADNLRRAVEAVPAESRGGDLMGKLLEGVEATERTLLQAFDKAGITQIEVLDKPFDPNFQEVMFEVENPDKVAGTVVQVFETGYKISERLLRPARVGIAKGGPRERIDTSA